jgi:TPR repeat protein
MALPKKSARRWRPRPLEAPWAPQAMGLRPSYDGNGSRPFDGPRPDLRDETRFGPNPVEAFRWFRSAAKAGIPEARLQLSHCNEHGYGVIPKHAKVLD